METFTLAKFTNKNTWTLEKKLSKSLKKVSSDTSKNAPLQDLKKT